MKEDKRKKLLTEEELKDLGFGSKENQDKRIINKDGTFNMKRKGIPFRDYFNFYHYLVSVSWPKFIIIIFSGYIFLNLIFACLYYAVGAEHLLGIIGQTPFEKFSEAFFFSAQSFTTVGYGRISPEGIITSSIASFEALIGLLSLALATGLLYGRFSRPVAKILYSKYALVSPFKNITGFMFRVANKQKSQMVDVSVRVMYSIIENGIRKFYALNLEYHKIVFFPSIWTVNHPIDEESPMFGKSEDELKNGKAEVLVLLSGFDDTFSTNVHARLSYSADEIIWGAKFVNIFGTDENGNGTVDLDRISEYKMIND
jgi:inward rectifier potassium channel